MYQTPSPIFGNARILKAPVTQRHPMMLGSGEVKQSWENEINQGGSTSALVPHPPFATSFPLNLATLTQFFTFKKFFTQSNICVHLSIFFSEMIKSKTATLRNSAWCPQPIVFQSFFVKNTTMGGPLPRVTWSWWQIFKQEIFLIILGQKIKRKANAKYLFFEPETTVKMWGILVC